MPRDIPVGNGKMLVAFDDKYQIRDIYFPHVGQENHVGGSPCRFGVWGRVSTGVPEHERRRQRVFWTYEGWNIRQLYQPGTLATHVVMEHDMLRVRLECCDVVDFHRNLLIRRIEIHNLDGEPRTFHLYHHNNFQIYGTKVGDTAYYDPHLRMMVHYREKRYIMSGFFVDGEQRLDEYATGHSGFNGAEGTWRDAEDGKLGCNPIAQGAVDATIGLHVPLGPAGDSAGTRTVYMVMGCGHSHEELIDLQKFLHREGPQGAIDRTTAYWRLWVGGNNLNFGDLPRGVVNLFQQSLLILRTQIDNNGAIVAANDSDIMQFARDTYSYVWPRDGAMVAEALDRAGFPDVTRSFYRFCSEIITDEGYFLHKYNPDGSRASSWHPWVVNGSVQLPIQEDETALVLWSLWKHYHRYRDVEFVRHLWVNLIQKAADFLVRFRDPASDLPLPSYDLWEERWGVHAFTVASVYGGLTAARNFAICFGDRVRAEQYALAARQVKEAFCRHMWSEQHGRFLRRLEPRDADRSRRMMEEVMRGNDPRRTEAAQPAADASSFIRDDTIDSSLFGIFAFGLLPEDDPRVMATMRAVREKLWVKTSVGGLARYERDHYHAISRDFEQIPGNPWFICTLWIADWIIGKATTIPELHEAVEVINWVAERALPSGVLAEQVHPSTNDPMSVSPLTWSHATVVSTVVKYLERLEQLSLCQDCHQPIFHVRRDLGMANGLHELIQQYETKFAGEADAAEDSPPDKAQTADHRCDHTPDASKGAVQTTSRESS